MLLITIVFDMMKVRIPYRFIEKLKIQRYEARMAFAQQTRYKRWRFDLMVTRWY